MSAHVCASMVFELTITIKQGSMLDLSTQLSLQSQRMFPQKIPKIANHALRCSSQLAYRSSCINVAELITDRAHSIPNLDLRREDTQVDNVIERGVGRRWGVEHRVRASNSVLALLQILVLPHPPCAIDLAVVQEEPGIAGRCEEISARVASDPEVATSMHAKVASREVALHSVLEAGNSGAVADELVCRGQWLAKLLRANEDSTTYS